MSYNNQIVSWGGGSTFTTISWAPTGATPTTPPFAWDDTNNQFYAYNGSAREAETDRTVWSGAPTWATPTNPPFYWDDVANKLYLWNGTAWETSASAWASWLAQWGINYYIDIINNNEKTVWAVTWKEISFNQIGTYCIYAKIKNGQYSWWSRIEIFRNVSWVLTLIEDFYLWGAYRDFGAVHYQDWFSKRFQVLNTTDTYLVRVSLAWTPQSLEQLELRFWEWYPWTLSTYVDFIWTTVGTGTWIHPTNTFKYAWVAESPYSPLSNPMALIYDYTAQHWTLNANLYQINVTNSWTYTIWWVGHASSDGPAFSWDPRSIWFQLFRNGTLISTRELWMFAILTQNRWSANLFWNHSLTAWDVLHIIVHRGTLTWINNQIYIKPV